MADRTCADCGKPISPKGKTGRCQPCATRFSNNDPAATARRKAGLANYYAQPGVRARHGARLVVFNRDAPADHREKMSRLARANYSRTIGAPEAKARSLSPEVMAKRSAAQIDTKLAWCPPERRDEYRRLCASLRLSAADARRMILDDERVKRNAARAAAKVPLSFEEQLARVAAGAKLVPTFKYRRPDPEMTLGGVAPEAM